MQMVLFTLIGYMIKKVELQVYKLYESFTRQHYHRSSLVGISYLNIMSRIATLLS